MGGSAVDTAYRVAEARVAGTIVEVRVVMRDRGPDQGATGEMLCHLVAQIRVN